EDDPVPMACRGGPHERGAVAGNLPARRHQPEHAVLRQRLSACLISGPVTEPFVPSAIVTRWGRRWRRRFRWSISTPSSHWRQPVAFAWYPSAARRLTARIMIESPIAIRARPFGFTRLLGFP